LYTNYFLYNLDGWENNKSALNNFFCYSRTNKNVFIVLQHKTISHMISMCKRKRKIKTKYYLETLLYYYIYLYMANDLIHVTIYLVMVKIESEKIKKQNYVDILRYI
jgi:hypothetical protein